MLVAFFYPGQQTETHVSCDLLILLKQFMESINLEGRSIPNSFLLETAGLAVSFME